MGFSCVTVHLMTPILFVHVKLHWRGYNSNRLRPTQPK